ncbi:MAG: hypothetical protein JMDDDDMK_05469 [Acidobacteria bacterium]|nr:hypothetical protein [Acidobacteriota bacterium]
MAVLFEGIRGFDLEIRIAGRDVNVARAGDGRVDVLFNRLFGEDETDAGAIFACRAVGRVVHIQDQRRALRNHLGAAWPVILRICTRRVAHHPILQPAPLLVPDVDDGVMYDAAVAGPDFGQLHVFILGEVGRDRIVLVRQHAVSRDAVLFRR